MDSKKKPTLDVTNQVIEPREGALTKLKHTFAPPGSPTTLTHHGRICVMGKLVGSGKPAHARARVYRHDELPGPNDSPSGDAAIGVTGDFIEPEAHHYRFIENDPTDHQDHTVAGARDNHTACGDPDNYLVVWTSNDGMNWTRWPEVQFKGTGADNKTECDSDKFKSKRKDATA